MKRILYICLVAVLATSCQMSQLGDPYGKDELNKLSIEVVYPDKYQDFDTEGLEITISDIDRGNAYVAKLDGNGKSEVELTNGRYIVQYSGRHGMDIFNATADQVLVSDNDVELTMNPAHSISGGLIIKEVYCGGCLKLPEEGTYQYDKYVIIHNNSDIVLYLDGLCYGILDPINSTATNIWVSKDPDTGATIYPDDLYLSTAIWQFGGDGTTFPLAPGEDAVLCNSGAIDHTAQYPLSVNLNKKDYFVLYDNVLFPMTTYHPAPGDQISPDRHLNVAIKLSPASGWPFSVSSPAPVIFRPKECTLEEYLAQSGVVIQKPATASEKVVKVPTEWVEDGVDVFDGGKSGNLKRFSPNVDAGYISLSESFEGKSLFRHVDKEASAEAGYEVLVDTNNSKEDFYERSQASLRDE